MTVSKSIYFINTSILHCLKQKAKNHHLACLRIIRYMCCTNYSIIIHVTAYDGLLQIFVVSITDNMCLTCIIVLHKPMCFIINKHLFAYHARSASAICLHPFSIEKCCFHDLR